VTDAADPRPDRGRRLVLDVSALPPIAAGPSAVLWWGVLGMVVIEGTMFVLVIAAWLYLRMNFPAWPPATDQAPPLVWSTLNLALLVVSVPAMRRASAAALERRLRETRTWLLAATAIGVLSLAVRVLEFAWLDFSWRSHAFGSVFWTALGLHTGHLLASVLETAVLIVLLFRKPMDDKHALDVEMDGIYWDFVVVSWIALYAALYLVPRLL
jgi:cytochrome c oxidase subunit I+III